MLSVGNNVQISTRIIHKEYMTVSSPMCQIRVNCSFQRVCATKVSIQSSNFKKRLYPISFYLSFGKMSSVILESYDYHALISARVTDEVILCYHTQVKMST